MGYYWAVNLLKVLTINTSSYWMSKSEMGDCSKHNMMDYLKDQPTGVRIFPHTHISNFYTTVVYIHMHDNPCSIKVVIIRKILSKNYNA